MTLINNEFHEISFHDLDIFQVLIVWRNIFFWYIEITVFWRFKNYNQTKM